MNSLLADLPVSPVILFAGGLVAWAVGRIIYLAVTNPLAAIPGPQVSKWSDVVVTYHWFLGRRACYVHSLHQKYGPIVRVSPDQVHINDVSAAREIHKVGGRFLKSPWYRTLVPTGVSNLFTAIDPGYHGTIRRLLAAPIADSSLKTFEPIFTERICLATDRIAEELEAHGVSDVFKWWSFLATDIIGELSFGESFRTLEQGKKSQYTLDLEYTASLQPIRTTFPFIVSLSRFITLPIFRKAYAAGMRMGTYAKQSIERYKKLMADNSEEPKPSLFTRLFDAGKYGLTDLEILHNAMGYIIAGSDTTAVTLTYLTYSVCRDDAIRHALTAELQTLPGNFTDAQCRELPYLSKVINETLRLYTAAPSALPRIVPPEGANLAGYQLPPGTTVSTQAYSLHRDPCVWSDPERFNPSRWDSPTKEMKDAFMPFGGGSRICIGLHLARIELRLAVAHFFRRFPTARVSMKDGMSEKDMEPKMYFLMAPQGHRCLIEA